MLLAVEPAALLLGQLHSLEASAEASPFRSASEAPRAWQAFAVSAKAHFERLLAPDTASVRHLIELLSRETGTASGGQVSLLLKAWIGADGKVDLVQFDNVKNPDVAVELRDILTSANVGAAPPLGMLQPLHLRLSLAQPNHPAGR